VGIQVSLFTDIIAGCLKVVVVEYDVLVQFNTGHPTSIGSK